MAPITITQALSASYNVPLPYYENRKGLQTASDPGETTKKYLAPAFAIKLDVSVWTNIGQLVLKDIKDGRLTRMLDEQYINEKEISMVHRNEADVVRAAAVHLLHSVHQALDLCPAAGQSVVASSEVQEERMRTDFCYFKVIDANRDPTPMAVIEFKRRGTLHEAKFMTGPVKRIATMNATTNNIPAPTAAEISAFKNEALAANPKEKTLFKDNALKCMKQISAYAVGRETKYCALFDYDALVLVRFDAYNKINKNVGDYCSITYIPYTNGSQFMRVALLGFLFEAWANTV
jgi:hypothetical protein